MLLESLYQTIEKLNERMETHRDKLSQSEALTRNALVDPLLRSLGWDTEDPALVMPEYKLGNGIADYALLNSGKPVIVVEAKKLGIPLDDAASQGISYCINDGIKYFAVTDGKKWDVYETHRTVPLADKKILSFDITNPSADVCLAALALWRRSVQSGAIRKAWTPLLDPEPQEAPLVTPNQPDVPLEPPAIPPIPEAVGNWQPLSQLQPLTGDKAPPEIRLPDGSIRPVKYWADIPLATVEWLIQQGRLDETGIPIQIGKRYILSDRLVHPTGADFKSPKNLGKFYLETNYNNLNNLRNSREIIEKIGKGVGLEQFSVRLPE